MNADENMVAKFLENYGLKATEFSKQERRNGKTPDFRVSRNDDLTFFCEVKTIEKDMIVGLRKDPVFNRISTDIHTAVKQFDAVNPKIKAPNVLALINHDRSCGFLDLIGVLSGNFITENEQPHAIYSRLSKGRINDEKGRVHLFLWLDDFKPQRFLFTQIHAEFHKQLCGWFGIAQSSIKQIGP